MSRRNLVLAALFLANVACSTAATQTDAGTQPDAGCAQVIGTEDMSGTGNVHPFYECCTQQGGAVTGGCMNPNGLGSARCALITAPTVDQFRCGDGVNCRFDQVCLSPQWQGDGCMYTECRTAPSPCETTPTCACATANHLYDSAACTQDDGGHATLVIHHFYP